MSSNSSNSFSHSFTGKESEKEISKIDKMDKIDYQVIHFLTLPVIFKHDVDFLFNEVKDAWDISYKEDDILLVHSNTMGTSNNPTLHRVTFSKSTPYNVLHVNWSEEPSVQIFFCHKNTLTNQNHTDKKTNAYVSCKHIDKEKLKEEITKWIELVA